MLFDLEYFITFYFPAFRQHSNTALHANRRYTSRFFRNVFCA